MLLAYQGHTFSLFRRLEKNGLDHAEIELSPDELFKYMILFSGLNFNLIYIGVFLVVTKRDCILLNTIS